jgi:hypothetical protein
MSLLDPHVKIDIKFKIIAKIAGDNLLHPKISITECEPFFIRNSKLKKYNLF